MSTVGRSTLETHRFVYSRWAARRTAAGLMVVLYALLLWAILGRDSDQSTWTELVIIGLSASAALVFLAISRHPIVRLKVGPDGISSPYGIMRPLAWREIARARYIPKHTPLSREWLKLELKPDAARIARIPLPAAIDRWLNRSGFWVPLHHLRDPSGDVLSSIERFMSVAETETNLKPMTGERTRHL